MTPAHELFAAQLRQQRERRGITLGAVAESTKITQSLLADLERGDLTRWPAGIFRRAFLREYAAAIGADPADLVSECVRLFPEPGTPPRPHQRDAAAHASHELRLTMASAAPRPVRMSRVTAAILDTLVVVGVTVLAAWASGGELWKIAASCAVVYYGGATLALGQSPASWYLAPRRRTRIAPRRLRNVAATHAAEAAGNRGGLIAS